MIIVTGGAGFIGSNIVRALNARGQNDILIVDRSVTPKHNDIVIAILDGEMTVKRIALDNDQVVLIPENDHYKPQKISEEMDFEIWGIVKHVVHSF